MNKFMEPPAFQRQIAVESEAYRLRNEEYGRRAQAQSLFLISCGAMDPLDRAEVEVYQAYMDAKHGKAEASTPKVSKRCQDYKDHKITIDQAVAMG